MERREFLQFFVSSLAVATLSPVFEAKAGNEISPIKLILGNKKIKSVDIYKYFDDYPYFIFNRSGVQFLNRVTNLSGEKVSWNTYKSHDPYGGSGYKSPDDKINGYWAYCWKLNLDKDKKEVWFWESRTNTIPDYYLTFAFRDLATNPDQNGNHNGAHHFEMAYIPKVTVKEIIKIRK